METKPKSLTMSAAFSERYEVLGELGSGSFGRVYRARQISTGQNIALKVLAAPRHVTGPDAERHRRRFEREMHLIASLSHPHIVRLIDSGDDEGTLYAAFEFLQGSTLREVLDTEGRLESGETLHLMTQVLDALSCAHESGIVHRDFKPENIMVTKTGARRNAVVLDFGLAGLTREAAELDGARLTATQEMMGTPAYSAPEQLRGEPASTRSDLYSWGLTMLECLTGEVAINGRTAYEAMTKQLSDRPVSIPIWLRDHRLGRLLATVTAKDPERREVDAAALLASLEAILHEISPAPAQPLVEPAKSAQGERRQVTVVACGILIAHSQDGPMDLEDLDRLERTQLELAADLAREEGGTLARAQPGRLVIVFGYPRAHENDARRALHVAQRIAGEVRAQASDTSNVDVRMGLDSGLCIVRLEPPGSDGEQWCQVAGAPLRISSRLEARAQAGEILVTDDTRVLLRGEAQCSPAGEVDAPEHSDGRLHVFRVAGGHSEKTDAPAERRESPLAGRTAELSRLCELWQATRAGEPAMVLVQGEAGIGKSRLLRELAREVSPQSWLECRCLPEDTASPLRPIVDLITALPEPIEDLLSRYGFDLPSTQPLFTSLLSLPPGSYSPLRLSPDRHKELTLKAVVSLLVRIATTEPRILAVEDLHWVDPTTLELLTLLVEECRAARAAGPTSPLPLLVVFTARPESEPPWSVDEAAHISLGRLRLGDIDRMVNADRSDKSTLPPELVERIAERTDGIPLFVEELAHALSGPEGGARAADELPIPGTLRELLASRLDGLSSSAYETAQIAAAYGRESPYDLLRVVAEADDRPEWILNQDIRELLDAGLLYQRSVANSYVFKHALVRDAAYDSMMRSVRGRVHGLIADALLTTMPHVTAERPEVVALHLFEGGDPFAASDYWHRAGDRALRHAAYEEAIAHLERGLDAVGRVPASPERDLREFDLLITLATVHSSTKGYAAPEVDETFGKARQLYDKLGEKVSPLKLFTGLFSMYVTRGDRSATDDILPTFTSLAGDTDDAVAGLTREVALVVDTFWRGEHERARTYVDRGRALYQTEEFQSFAQDYGYDGGIFIYGYSVWNSCIAGRHDEAASTYRELSELAETSFDPYSLPLALAFGMAAAHARRDVAETLARAQRLIEMSNEQRMYLWLAIGQCGAGWALAMNKQAEEGIALLRQGLDLCRLTGAMTPYSYYLTYLAGALLEAGAFEESKTTVDEGLELCEHAVARAHEPELMRIRGELLRAAGDDAEAETWLRRALTLAEQRGAGTWAMRSGVSLARLLRDRDDTTEAKTILDSVMSTFPEAITEPDRADADAVLGD